MNHPKLEHLEDGTVECGPGWYPLIEQLLSSLSENCYPVQIKEKFGMLRCYVEGGTDEDYARISDAECASAQICEQCGAPGCLRGVRWVYTSCDACDNNEPQMWESLLESRDEEVK